MRYCKKSNPQRQPARPAKWPGLTTPAIFSAIIGPTNSTKLPEPFGGEAFETSSSFSSSGRPADLVRSAVDVRRRISRSLGQSLLSAALYARFSSSWADGSSSLGSVRSCDPGSSSCSVLYPVRAGAWREVRARRRPGVLRLVPAAHSASAWLGSVLRRKLFKAAPVALLLLLAGLSFGADRKQFKSGAVAESRMVGDSVQTTITHKSRRPVGLDQHLDRRDNLHLPQSRLPGRHDGCA